VAIIFPKYKDRPINGDEVQPGDAARTNVAVDVRSLAGGDLLAKLRARSDGLSPDAAADAMNAVDAMNAMKNTGQSGPCCAADGPADSPPAEVIDSLRSAAGNGRQCACDCGGESNSDCNGAAESNGRDCDCNCDGDGNCNCNCDCDSGCDCDCEGTGDGGCDCTQSGSSPSQCDPPRRRSP